MSVGFWFDTKKINEQAEKELKEEHFRRLVDDRKAYLEGRKRPWWTQAVQSFLSITDRRTMTEDIVRITVLGDCGKTHESVEEWQQCVACGIILADRLRS